MKIAEIQNLETGDAIQELSGTLKYVNEPKNKTQSFVLKDDTGETRLFARGRSEVKSDKQGSKVKLTCGQQGNGLKVEDNEWPPNSGNFTRRVSVGPGAVFKEDGSGNPEPSTQTTSASSPVNGRTPVFGGTAGCAVKLAVDLLIKCDSNLAYDYVLDGEFPDDVHKLASSLVRVMQRIEKGDLAPEPQDKVIEAFKDLAQAPADPGPDWE